MGEKLRLTMAMLAAALIPAAYFGVPEFLDQYPLYGAAAIQPTIVVTAIAFLFSAVVIVALGLPAFLLLRRHKLVRWWTALLAGFVGAYVTMALFGLWLDGGAPGLTWQNLADGLPAGGLGMASALAAWAVWRLPGAPTKSAITK